VFRVLRIVLVLAVAAAVRPTEAQLLAAQQPPGRGQGRSTTSGAAPAPTAATVARPIRLTIAQGSRARYRVREQLAGISFPSDAVGTTEEVSGSLVVNPDGSVDTSHSKIVIGLKKLTSDQQMRDSYIQNRVLDTDQFPNMEFAPKRLVGFSGPLPTTGQAGFQIVGDMTMHNVTAEGTWNVIVTFRPDVVDGRGTANVTFETFKLTKPSLARLLSVDDHIDLEIEFHCQRGTL
jgi:polyisoprenoid-binding protein YceI